MRLFCALHLTKWQFCYLAQGSAMHPLPVPVYYLAPRPRKHRSGPAILLAEQEVYPSHLHFHILLEDQIFH